uniref:Candidate secreted effector n=1 Tax=Meloidogyne incognita TaxID=6306 RepID=A0A914N1Q0_MELIC
MQIKATISVSIQQLAILFFYNPFHIIIKHYSGCCGCNQCHCNVIFVMWAYKFSSLLIRNGKKIWSQHLYCTKFKFWIIENGMIDREYEEWNIIAFYTGGCKQV